MALALYRKYRPRTFAEVIGQEHVTEPLSQALRSGRLHHAYLFSGPRGCGKTSSARILARSLNCERGPTPEPCGVCASCRSLATDGSGSIDVIEIDAASHGGVDDARELRERAFFAPAASRFKIYVIDEAHMVSTQGFNALLKLVEEPPDYVKFIFATTEPDKVLGTIKSRTHHYPFRLIPPGILRPYLEQLADAENVKIEPAVFPLVVRAGGGSARDSLSVLDQLIAGAGPEGVGYARAVALLGVTDAALIDEMCDALAAGDGAAAYATIDRVAEAGHDPRRFASDLLERLRDLIVMQQVPDAAAKGLIDGPADQLERMSAQAQRLGPATLSRCADIVHNGLIEMRGTTAPRLLLELITARMLLPAGDEGGLRQRVERMEQRLARGADFDDDYAGPAVLAPPAPAASRPAPSGDGPDDAAPAGEAVRPAAGGGAAAARAAAAAAATRSGNARRVESRAGRGTEANAPESASAAPPDQPVGRPSAHDEHVAAPDESGPGPDAARDQSGRGSDESAGGVQARGVSGVGSDAARDGSGRGSDESAGPARGQSGSVEPAGRVGPDESASQAATRGDAAGSGAPAGDEAGISRSGRAAGGTDGGEWGDEPGDSADEPVAATDGDRRRVPPQAVMADPATPEPVIPQATPGAQDAASVRRVWDEIVAMVRVNHKRIAALATEATVRDIDGDTLVLTFRHSFHANNLSKEPEPLLEAIYEVLGERWQIRCEVAGDQRGAGPAPERAPERPAATRDSAGNAAAPNGRPTTQGRGPRERSSSSRGQSGASGDRSDEDHPATPPSAPPAAPTSALSASAPGAAPASALSATAPAAAPTSAPPATAPAPP
ncbi:DNA polymerase III subunit gamma and tau, partial [Asanoa siamensis]|uniref:DNA polymerase III subunit gamma and tau n=1 Tax=Asanoa siamensis TaxID=926357 RepID=UPI001EF3BD4F